MAASGVRTDEIGHLDAVGLPWLVTVRWAGVVALAGATAAGAAELARTSQFTLAASLIAATLLSNVWLSWRLRRRLPLSRSAAGSLVCADILVLSWLLHESGGVLNPASIFYLVDIVLAALVLDRVWAWGVTILCVAGYGLLFLTPPAGLAAAGSMHPEIQQHVRGMWLAFAGTALMVALLVARLAALIERRDRALAVLRERSARDARLAGLATLAAGAAHELSTPLGTIAVAARELELALAGQGDGPPRDDAQLIRAEVERCRRILHDMSARVNQPVGEPPVAQPLRRAIDAVVGQLSTAERARVDLRVPDDVQVVWPSGVVTRALINVIRNALQASVSSGAPVAIRAGTDTEGHIALAVEDAGEGMAPDVLARAGEPFYSTKPEGDGTGLGLFVARSAIEQLGGSLTITSRQAVGTTVAITLPVDASPGRDR